MTPEKIPAPISAGAGNIQEITTDQQGLFLGNRILALRTFGWRIIAMIIYGISSIPPIIAEAGK
jgi:hypothetical protein